MKQRFYVYRRGETFYLQDSKTGKQQSLETKDKKAALRLLEIKRQTAENPGFNQFIVKSCLSTQDPLLPKRTWQAVTVEDRFYHERYSALEAKAAQCLNIIRNAG